MINVKVKDRNITNREKTKLELVKNILKRTIMIRVSGYQTKSKREK